MDGLPGSFTRAWVAGIDWALRRRSLERSWLVRSPRRTPQFPRVHICLIAERRKSAITHVTSASAILGWSLSSVTSWPFPLRKAGIVFFRPIFQRFPVAGTLVIWTAWLLLLLSVWSTVFRFRGRGVGGIPTVPVICIMLFLILRVTAGKREREPYQNCPSTNIQCFNKNLDSQKCHQWNVAIKVVHQENLQQQKCT